MNKGKTVRLGKRPKFVYESDKHKREESKRISVDVQAYLDAGHKIEQAPNTELTDVYHRKNWHPAQETYRSRIGMSVIKTAT